MTEELLPVWQHDPSFRLSRYDPRSSYTFSSAGCLVCSLERLLHEAGYSDTPPQVARAIAERGAFSEGELVHPSKVELAYPKVKWHYDKFLLGEYSSYVNWDRTSANLDLLQEVLSKQSCPVKVDFIPSTKAIDQHFMLALKGGYEPDPTGGNNDSLWCLDPWVGSKINVTSYLSPYWMYDSRITKVQRVLLGMRVWEIIG